MEASKLFFAVVNSTKQHDIIDAVASGTREQKISALGQLLIAPQTPKHLLNTLQQSYSDLINNSQNNDDIYYDGYMRTNLTGSELIPNDDYYGVDNVSDEITDDYNTFDQARVVDGGYYYYLDDMCVGD
ncbi:hypothetical protein E24_00104 [Faustovirus]|nr:hypothetical protein PRJ_Fausto_00092 [Faustovirus]AMN83036.1 hypothetical protein E24_00104 [Faustovirus]AMN84020.1 hypothetical protein D5a_00104 [Faustovirus]AMN85006.1 hypothetical protein E23_00104 [Faustovirus]QBR99006.1 hypothetical protein [Faustovirus mariensis]